MVVGGKKSPNLNHKLSILKCYVSYQLPHKNSPQNSVVKTININLLITLVHRTVGQLDRSIDLFMVYLILSNLARGSMVSWLTEDSLIQGSFQLRWIGSVPPKFSSSSRLSWTCSHGNHMVQARKWNAQGLLRSRIRIDTPFFLQHSISQDKS